MTYFEMGLAAVSVLQMAMLVAIWARGRRASRTEARLSHFAEALALLTDTMEAGLSNVALELESARKRAPRQSTRAATAKRIATAVKRGDSIEDIVATEAISESEIRLHLGMTGASTPSPQGGRHGALLG